MLLCSIGFLVLQYLYRVCCLVPSQSRVFNDAGRGMTRSTVTLMVLHVLLGLEHSCTAAHKAVALIDCMLIQHIEADEGCTAKACFAVHVETLLSVSHFATKDRNSIGSYSSSPESSKGFPTESNSRMSSECLLFAGRLTSRKVKVVEIQVLCLVPCTSFETPRKSGDTHVQSLCNQANGDIRARTVRIVGRVMRRILACTRCDLYLLSLRRIRNQRDGGWLGQWY